jgi:hypothetical protein
LQDNQQAVRLRKTRNLWFRMFFESARIAYQIGNLSNSAFESLHRLKGLPKGGLFLFYDFPYRAYLQQIVSAINFSIHLCKIISRPWGSEKPEISDFVCFSRVHELPIKLEIWAIRHSNPSIGSKVSQKEAFFCFMTFRIVLIYSKLFPPLIFQSIFARLPAGREAPKNQKPFFVHRVTQVFINLLFLLQVKKSRQKNPAAYRKMLKTHSLWLKFTNSLHFFWKIGAQTAQTLMP